MIPCHRCQQLESRTRYSRIWGCRQCKNALSEQERAEMRDAHYAKLGAALRNKHEEEDLQRRRAARSALQAEVADTFDDAFAQARRLRASEAPSSLVQRGLAAERELLYARKVTTALQAEPLLPRCACCFTPSTQGTDPFTETFDGKLWCRLCAHGVVACGFCTPHNSRHYDSELQPLSIAAYPDSVLAPFPRSMFTNDDDTVNSTPEA